MNIVRPPPCPPSDWSEILNCWRDVENFKGFMSQIINDMIASGDLNLATKNYVDQAVSAASQNIITGVTDGSIAGPGIVGESIIGSVAMDPARTPLTVTSDSVPSGILADELLMTLPAGAWQVSVQMAVMIVAPPGPLNGYLTDCGMDGYLGPAPFAQVRAFGGVGLAVAHGFGGFYIPTLIWSGSFTEPTEIRVVVRNVLGLPTTTFNYSMYGVAFRYR